MTRAATSLARGTPEDASQTLRAVEEAVSGLPRSVVGYPYRPLGGATGDDLAFPEE